MTTDLLLPGGLAGVDVAIEATAPEAEPLSAFLTSEGARTRIVTPDELDREPSAEAAFLDAWTPEVSTRVSGLRDHRAVVTCLADLLLARTARRTIGVTGTAGKTTTTSFIGQLLGDAVLPEPGLSDNLWPDASLLAALPSRARIVMELTSSHLAFCHHSPEIAVVTSFWPDHIELHGSLEAYRRAKEMIARGQTGAGWLVVPADGSCDSFVTATAARVARFSVADPVERGAFVRRRRLVVRWEDEEHELAGVDDLPLRGASLANTLAACAAALVSGVPPAALADGLRDVRILPHRFVEIARVGGVPVYDNSMAGTPAKARAALEIFPDHSISLVAGGSTVGAAGPVHATDAERKLLDAACAVARRKARRTVMFGAAAERLTGLLPGSEVADTLDAAVELAVAGIGASQAVLIAPMFPVSPEERTRVATRAFPA